MGRVGGVGLKACGDFIPEDAAPQALKIPTKDNPAITRHPNHGIAKGPSPWPAGGKIP
jgi:hypothetical protein